MLSMSKASDTWKGVPSLPQGTDIPCAELSSQPSSSSAGDSRLPFYYVTARNGQGGVDFVVVSSAKCFHAVNCTLRTLQSFFGP